MGGELSKEFSCSVRITAPSKDNLCKGDIGEEIVWKNYCYGCTDNASCRKNGKAFCEDVGGASEWDYGNLGDPCKYNDCHNGQETTTSSISGCCNGCCSWGGNKISCKRNSFKADQLKCCLNDMKCNQDSSDDNPDSCFQDSTHQKTCDPENRDITSTNCKASL